MWKSDKGFGGCCDKEYKSETCGCEHGLAIDVFDNNSGEKEIKETLAFLTSTGDTPFDLNDKMVRLGRRLMNKKVVAGKNMLQ